MALTKCYPCDEDGGEYRAGWRIVFRYDAELVERLKAAIPHYDRKWWPEKLEWWVAIEHEATLRRLFPDFALYADAPRLFELI